MADGGMKIVARKQTELCKPVCLSKSSIAMLQRFIRSMIRGIAHMQNGPDDRYIRITLQRDDATYEASAPESEMPPSTKPYVFDATYGNGGLDLTFFATLDSGRYFSFPYNIGDALDLSRELHPDIYRRLQ